MNGLRRRRPQHFHSPSAGETIFSTTSPDKANPVNFEIVALCACGRLVHFTECGHGYLHKEVAANELLDLIEMLRVRHTEMAARLAAEGRAA